MNPPSVLGVAVVGCGILARSQHIPNILQSPGMQLVVCCDIDENALKECGRIAPGVRTTRDFESAIGDPAVDMVVIATSETFRIPLFEAAARHNKPVYTEKPLADSWENAQRLAAIARESGIPVCVGHNRRCSPAMVEAREIFRRHIEHPGDCPWRFDRAGWETIRVGDEDKAPAVAIRINDDWHSWKAVHLQGQNAEFGLVLSEMTHFTDVACWFLDKEPESVMALGTGILNHCVAVTFKGGGLASITMGSNGTFGYPKELYEFMGNGGVVAVDHMLEVRTAGVAGAAPRKTYEMLNDRHPDVGVCGGFAGWLEKKRKGCEEAVAAGDPMRQFCAEPDKGHKRMLEEFAREIRGERGAVSPIASALRASRICFAAIRSLREKRVVAIEEI